MRLVSFSVRRYRSILETEKVPIRGLTILVGPNNEGKSNLLRALDLSLRLVTAPWQFPRRHVPSPLVRDYDWERDFPIALRTRSRGSKQSSFILEFELSDAEIREFQDNVGSRLNGTLPVQITLGQDGADLKISKQGPGAVTLNKRIDPILGFVRERLTYTYIPSVRTAESSTRIVERILAEELSVIEGDQEYRDAMRAIAELQEPVLAQLTRAIETTLREFLPSVQSARVIIEEEERHAALRRAVSVRINDGDETDLGQKGDGVQSLAAIAMMRFAAQRRAGTRHVVLSVEEPESHLHPAAVQQVRKVLQEISERHQVIITTHSPELVDRVSIKSNILVSAKHARPARTLDSVRDALGVQPSHDLRHAELMVLVEGPSDARMLTALTAATPGRLADALRSGELVFAPLDGVHNLPYVARLHNAGVQPIHCFIDNDRPALEAYRRARETGVLLEQEASFATCRGQRESEMEDLICVASYKAAVESHFGVSLDHPRFRSAQKWSERCRQAFQAQARAWDDATCAEVKGIIADCVVASPDTALIPERREVIDSLMGALATRLACLRT